MYVVKRHALVKHDRKTQRMIKQSVPKVLRVSLRDCASRKLIPIFKED